MLSLNEIKKSAIYLAFIVYYLLYSFSLRFRIDMTIVFLSYVKIAWATFDHGIMVAVGGRGGVFEPAIKLHLNEQWIALREIFSRKITLCFLIWYFVFVFFSLDSLVVPNVVYTCGPLIFSAILPIALPTTGQNSAANMNITNT